VVQNASPKVENEPEDEGKETTKGKSGGRQKKALTKEKKRGRPIKRKESDLSDAGGVSPAKLKKTNAREKNPSSEGESDHDTSHSHLSVAEGDKDESAEKELSPNRSETDVVDSATVDNKPVTNPRATNPSSDGESDHDTSHSHSSVVERDTDESAEKKELSPNRSETDVVDSATCDTKPVTNPRATNLSSDCESDHDARHSHLSVIERDTDESAEKREFSPDRSESDVVLQSASPPVDTNNHTNERTSASVAEESDHDNSNLSVAERDNESAEKEELSPCRNDADVVDSSTMDSKKHDEVEEIPLTDTLADPVDAGVIHESNFSDEVPAISQMELDSEVSGEPGVLEESSIDTQQTHGDLIEDATNF